MRLLFILLILSLQALLGWLYYADQTSCCNQNAIDTISVKVPEQPILFNWSSPQPVTGQNWQTVKDSLLQLVTEKNKLEITAWYCIEENEEISPDSLGIRRANAIRSLFPEVIDQNILLVTREVRCDSVDKNAPFEAAGFAIRTITKNITETENETTIYFPSNSTQKSDAADVENYLDNVAARVIASGETIVLTGHTDALGSAETNIVLGRKRAEIIRDYLISKGVSPEKIQVRSEGEQSPAADNKTPDGQAKNRRTTLQIIP